MEYRQPVHQSNDQSNSSRKEMEKQPCGEEIEGQELRSRRDHHREEKYKGRASDMRAIF